jgi:hypothetical protein
MVYDPAGRILIGWLWHCSHCRDHILAVQVLRGMGPVVQRVRWAAAYTCSDLDFDCGWADYCRGDYIPEPIMKKVRRGPIAAVCLRALYLLEGCITDGGLEYLLDVRR